MSLYSSYGYDMDRQIMTILLVYLICFLVIGIVRLADYILKGFGMYTMAKHRGIQYPWLAFVPFARMYLQGTLAGNIQLKKKTIKDTGIWLIVMPFMFQAVYFALFMIIWVIGFGSMAISFLTYSSASVGAGKIGFIVVLCVILVLASGAYGVLYKVFRILVNRQIYDELTSGNMPVVHAVLSVLVPLYESISFFVMRNKSAQEDTETAFETASNVMMGEYTIVEEGSETKNCDESEESSETENCGEPKESSATENCGEPEAGSETKNCGESEEEK